MFESIADPSPCMGDFPEGVGGFFGPHFDQERTGVVEVAQGLEAVHEIDGALAEGNVAEGAGRVRADRQRFLDMDADDVVDAEFEEVKDK